MNRRLGRVLLALYPARVRRRYGAELLALQDELRREGTLPLPRLIRDAIAGALIAHAARGRSFRVAGGALVVGALAAAVILMGSGPRSGASRSPHHPSIVGTAHILSPAPPGPRVCLITTGMSCSAQAACPQFVDAPPVRTAAAQARLVLRLRRSRRTTRGCVRATVDRPHVVEVVDLSPSVPTSG